MRHFSLDGKWCDDPLIVTSLELLLQLKHILIFENALCSLTLLFCSTDCSVLDYIMLVIRVVELLLVTMVTVLLIKAQ